MSSVRVCTKSANYALVCSKVLGLEIVSNEVSACYNLA